MTIKSSRLGIRRAVFVSSLAAILSCSLTAAAATLSVLQTAHYSSGGVKWDYLTYDGPGDRLFVTRGDHVDVVDPQTLAVTASLPGAAGIHGVALAQDLGKGFISNGKAGAVIVFDLKTLKINGTVKAEPDADAIVYDAATHRVFTANGDSQSLTAIDARRNASLGRIKLDGKPEFTVVDGKGHLFVNIEDKSQLAVVDTRSLQVKAVYDLAPACQNPAGLSIDLQRERLFAGCRGQTMAIVDGKTGRILAAPPIGKQSDATRFDADRNLAFSSNGDGTLTVIAADGPDSYRVQQTIATAAGARTMELDAKTHRLYLVTAAIDHVDLPTVAVPHPRPKFKENSFMLLVVGEPSTP